MKTLRVVTISVLCMLLAVGNAGAVTTTATVSATVSSTESISLNPTSIDFGTIGGTQTTYRYKSSAVSVSYFAPGPYEIRVYTDNDVGAGATDARGHIRTIEDDKLFLKIWCPNFNANTYLDAANGPSLGSPSSMTQYLWVGQDFGDGTTVGNLDGDTDDVYDTVGQSLNESTFGADINGDGDTGDTIVIGTDEAVAEAASLSWIRELDTMTEGETPADTATRCILAWNTPTRGDASLSNPFNSFFAVDLNGIANGSYSSANNVNPGVTFELLIY